MDHADQELENRLESFYDRVRRPTGGLRLINGSYTELFTGSEVTYLLLNLNEKSLYFLIIFA